DAGRHRIDGGAAERFRKLPGMARVGAALARAISRLRRRSRPCRRRGSPAGSSDPPMFKVTAPAFCAPVTVGSDGPFNVTKMLVKSMPPTARPMIGVKMSLTRLFTTEVDDVQRSQESVTVPGPAVKRGGYSERPHGFGRVLWTRSGLNPERDRRFESRLLQG